ncbi:MAG: hypothetical protein NTX82_03915 [Candidatus Parcubacteria bacterium]|nr:hypothetical protein [Candidatus Parcubacteria bacterium]
MTKGGVAMIALDLFGWSDPLEMKTGHYYHTKLKKYIQVDQ